MLSKVNGVTAAALTRFVFPDRTSLRGWTAAALLHEAVIVAAKSTHDACIGAATKTPSPESSIFGKA